MQAIIPVAGIGKRLRPLTDSIPKPLIPVAGKPILGHIIDELTDAGIDHVILIIGYLGDKIRRWAKQTYPAIRIECVLQEKMDGLASAIYLAKSVLDDGPTLVVLGDTLFSADLNAATANPANMIAVKKVRDPKRFGVVVKNESGLVTGLVEKPEVFVSNLAITGIYSFRSSGILMRTIAELIESGKTTKGEYQLTDAMQLMLEAGHLFDTFEIDGWYDCGTPDTLLETNMTLLRTFGSCGTETAVNSTIAKPVFIAPTASVSNSDLGPFASIGDNCTVDNCIIRNSILYGAVSLSGVTAEDSIIGDSGLLKGTSALRISSTHPSTEANRFDE